MSAVAYETSGAVAVINMTYEPYNLLTQPSART